jgi:hypothetical protein
MTSNQKKSIDDLHDGYSKNCQKFVGWGSLSVCKFIVYHNESDENDKNMVVSMIEIDGISDNNQLFMKNQNILVEEDGSVYVLEDLFSRNKVVTYLQKLKPLNWNG